MRNAHVGAAPLKPRALSLHSNLCGSACSARDCIYSIWKKRLVHICYLFPECISVAGEPPHTWLLISCSRRNLWPRRRVCKKNAPILSNIPVSSVLFPQPMLMPNWCAPAHIILHEMRQESFDLNGSTMGLMRRWLRTMEWENHQSHWVCRVHARSAGALDIAKALPWECIYIIRCAIGLLCSNNYTAQ